MKRYILKRESLDRRLIEILNEFNHVRETEEIAGIISSKILRRLVISTNHHLRNIRYSPNSLGYRMKKIVIFYKDKIGIDFSNILNYHREETRKV